MATAAELQAEITRLEAQLSGMGNIDNYATAGRSVKYRSPEKIEARIDILKSRLQRLYRGTASAPVIVPSR